jgi:hypothetical protein
MLCSCDVDADAAGEVGVAMLTTEVSSTLGPIDAPASAAMFVAGTV